MFDELGFRTYLSWESHRETDSHRALEVARTEKAQWFAVVEELTLISFDPLSAKRLKML